MSFGKSFQSLVAITKSERSVVLGIHFGLTTERGTLRIQRQVWRLTLVANGYDFSHVALSLRRKR